MTRAVIDVAKAMGIVGHDHVIIGRDGPAGLTGMKLMREVRS